MISGLLGRMLASMLLKKVAISVLISFLKSMTALSDNKVDDKMVAALEKALKGKK